MRNCKYTDLKGIKVGYLHIIERVKSSYNNKPVHKWLCTCVCGNTREILPQPLLRSIQRINSTISCGCINPTLKHGHAVGKNRTKEYKTWKNMKERCYRVTCERYNNYGGRGIIVCNRWLIGDNEKSGFECFLEDMGSKPMGYSIERKNVNGNYEPKNCIWASKEQQDANKQNTVWITYKGVKKSAVEWAQLLNTTNELLTRRVKWGWSSGNTLGLSDGVGRKRKKHYHFSKRLIRLRNIAKRERG